MSIFNPSASLSSVQAIYTVASGSIPTTPNNVVYSNVVIDTNSAYNPGTALFTVPVAGTYSVYAKGLVITTATTTGGSIDFFIYKNGTSVQHKSIYTYASTTGSFYVDVQYAVVCVVGDTLGIYSSASTGITSPSFSSSAMDGNVSFIRSP